MEENDKPQTNAPAPTPTEPKPTLGRIVIYYAHRNDGIVAEAAIICHVWSGDTVNLHVFEGNGQTYLATSVGKGGKNQPGTWAYPERV